jgi:hypothetical protein
MNLVKLHNSFDVIEKLTEEKIVSLSRIVDNVALKKEVTMKGLNFYET